MFAHPDFCLNELMNALGQITPHFYPLYDASALTLQDLSVFYYSKHVGRLVKDKKVCAIWRALRSANFL